MIGHILFALLCLGTLVARGPADEGPLLSEGDLKGLQGVWNSPILPSPGSRDAVIQRTLEIGRSGKPEAVRLSWSMYCGRSRITGGDSYAGRVLGVEKKDRKRLLVLVGEKGARFEIEFELSGDQLRLKGAIKDVDVSFDWTRQPAAKKQ